MTRPTTDVSAGYAQFAAGGQAAAFAADSPSGGDRLAVQSGRIDPGRMELHQAVERELATSGGTYDDALNRTRRDPRTCSTASTGSGARSATRAGAQRFWRVSIRRSPITNRSWRASDREPPPFPAADPDSELASEQLAQRLRGLGYEDADLDYKQNLYGNTDQAKRDLAAMANGRGGLIIIGIRDDNDVAAERTPVELVDGEE